MKFKKIVLLLIIPVMLFAACQKTIIEPEPEPVDPVFLNKTAQVEYTNNVYLSELADTVNYYNANQEYANITVDNVIIDDPSRLVEAFQVDDYVVFNDIVTGIDEIGKSGNEDGLVVEIIIPEDLHVSNTSLFDHAFYPVKHSEIGNVDVEGATGTDTSNWTSTSFAEGQGLDIEIDPETTVIDVAGAYITADDIVEFQDGNGSHVAISDPAGDLGQIAEGDTIQWTYASPFEYEGTTPYFNGVGSYIQTTMPSTYTEPYVNSILGNLPENYLNITFLFNDGSHIPVDFYLGKGPR